jgi:ribosome maturation factor RimP
MASLHERIAEWLAPKLEELEAYLVDVRHNVATRRIEVYLDREQPGKAIDLDACAAASRFLETYLDAAEGVPADYVLEVSSPGMGNPFKVLRQYTKHIGARVEVVMQDGRKLEGVLAAADENGIDLDEFTTPLPKGKPKPGQKVVMPETVRQAIPFSQIKSTKRSFAF